MGMTDITGMTVCSGRSKDVPLVHTPPTDHNFLNFMQFFGKYGKIVSWHPPEGWGPLLWGILDPPLIWQEIGNKSANACRSLA